MFKQSLHIGVMFSLTKTIGSKEGSKTLNGTTFEGLGASRDNPWSAQRRPEDQGLVRNVQKSKKTKFSKYGKNDAIL